jgi:hypothetical protein
MKNIFILATLVFTLTSPAVADVKTKADNGFSVFHSADIDATPDAIWKRLISPKEYWSKENSWSGSVAGFTLDPRPGGCFCEAMQEPLPGGKFKTICNVEHMRVIFAQPGKVLRMQGALGPLQSEAMLGTLTVAIGPAKSGSGSTVTFSYVAGGYMRYKPADIANVVDKVIGEQFAGLIAPFTGASPSDAKSAEWSMDVDKVTGSQTVPQPGAQSGGQLGSSTQSALDGMKLPTGEEVAKAPAPVKSRAKTKPKVASEETR